MKCPHCGGTVAVALRSVSATETNPLVFADPKPAGAEPTAKEKRLARIAARRTLTPVLYSAITPRTGQSVADVIRSAHALGYELVPFNGWDDDDLGPSGMPGPRRHEAKLNASRLREIVDSQTVTEGKTYDCPVISQVAQATP